MSDAPVSREEWDTWRALIDMRRTLDLTIDRQLQRDADVSGSEFGVLINLFEADEKQLRAGDLGLALGWEKSRVSHQVSRMERRGLVERRKCDSDGRGTWVGLTPDGSRAVLRAMRDHSATLRRHFFDVLAPDELAMLRTASERVLATIDPADCDADEDDDRPDVA